MAKSPVKMLVDKLPKVKKSLSDLSESEVLVGVPQNKGVRKEGDIDNATLAYIHDNGSPAANIPARPFMIPGIMAVKKEISDQFKLGAGVSLKKSSGSIDSILHRVGMIAQASIRNKIDEGIPPPLKTGTLKGRIRKRTAIKGAKMELKHRKGGGEATLTNAKPLVATGQLRNSINYVIRKK